MSEEWTSSLSAGLMPGAVLSGGGNEQATSNAQAPLRVEARIGQQLQESRQRLEAMLLQWNINAANDGLYLERA